MDRLYTYLNWNYLALKNAIEKEAFKYKMQKVFKDVLFSDKWNEERHKIGYASWMEDKLTNTLYNNESIIEEYKKLQDVPLEPKELPCLRTKVNLFSGLIPKIP